MQQITQSLDEKIKFFLASKIFRHLYGDEDITPWP
jgi:hypothetical protein